MVAFAHWLNEGATRFGVAVHGWVFMTNHIHLMVTPSKNDSLSRMMQFVGRFYVRRFNHVHFRTGSLFEGRFRTCLVEEDRYFLTCLRYIELNPVRAGMVRDPGDYHWSSYGCHAYGTRAGMWTPHELYLGLGPDAVLRQAAWRDLVSEGLRGDVLARVRACANSGRVLGSKSFREEVRQMRE